MVLTDLLIHTHTRTHVISMHRDSELCEIQCTSKSGNSSHMWSPLAKHKKKAYSREDSKGDQGDGQTEDRDGATHIGNGGKRHLMCPRELHRKKQRNKGCCIKPPIKWHVEITPVYVLTVMLVKIVSAVSVCGEKSFYFSIKTPQCPVFYVVSTRNQNKSKSWSYRQI